MRSASLALSLALGLLCFAGASRASTFVSIPASLAVAGAEDWFSPSADSPKPASSIKEPASPKANPDTAAPMAPLPPAIVIGPVGIALAAWTHYRMRRRRGM